jgi:hypothetical protein
MSQFEVFDLPRDQLVRLKSFLGRQLNGPLRHLNIDQVSDLEGFWLSDIDEALKNQEGHVVCAESDDKIMGLLVYTNLPWESRLFRKRMGALKYLVVKDDVLAPERIIDNLLECALARAVSLKVDFLLCRTYTNDMVTNHALQKKGFFLMDTLLDFVYDFRNPLFDTVPPPVLRQGFSVRPHRPEDSKELIKISRAAFSKHFGRFHSDPRISNAEATRIYEEWIKSCCSGWANWIVIAEKAGRIVGYSVWKKPSQLEERHRISLGHYSIGAIHPDFHGHGLFSVLTYEGMKLFKNSTHRIEGPTHVNCYAVERAYTNLGWKICDAHHSFHKWLRS